ncbi:MAG: hypothetical protein IMF05_01955 [Proteobacteria bacterium]|nr:hypothetical protein [Pseudomonadota bacterium]
MSYASKPGHVREAVAAFRDVAELEATIDELQESGFDRAEISLLASEEAVEKKLGHYYDKPSEIEDDPDAPRVAYVSRESLGAAEGGLISGPLYVAAVTSAGLAIAAGGPLAIAVTVAVLGGGAGALIGAVLAGYVGQQYARHIEEQLEHGGIVLWVNLRDAQHEERAVNILRKHGAADVIHEVPGPR